MNNPALYRLLAWLSPSYPVGSFSYSHGLEWLVEEGSIHSLDTLTLWLSDILHHGSGTHDAILLSHSWRAAHANDIPQLLHIHALANSFAASRERKLESQSQGDAFADITCRTWEGPSLEKLRILSDDPISYPVAIGIAAADHTIDLTLTLECFLHSAASNLISAGLRLIPLGHSDGQRCLRALEPVLADCAKHALHADLQDLGGSAFMADIAAMKHETQYTRLFRS